MPNQNQFTRQAAAVLLACGLITGLLLQSVQAQQVTEAEIQTRITGMVSRAANANISPATATNDPVLRYDREQLGALIGRLMQSPPDPAALQALSEWYNTYPRGDMFNHYSTAFAANIWWPQLSTAQQENIRNNMSTIFDWIGLGTPNHQLMRNVGGALYGQLWPNEAVFRIGGETELKTGQEIVNRCKERLMAISKNLNSRGEYEYMSQTYWAVHIGPWVALYDQTNDPELKAAANAALRYFTTVMAHSHVYGRFSTLTRRENVSSRHLYSTADATPNLTSLQQIAWLLWGDNSRSLVGHWDARRVGGSVYITAASSWRAPAAINRIAPGNENVSTKTSYNYSNHAGGTVAQSTAYPNSSGQAYQLPHPFANQKGFGNVSYYREGQLFAMASKWLNWDPDEFYGQSTGTGIIYNVTGAKGAQMMDIAHPYWKMNRQSGQGDFEGRQSPFESKSHHLNTFISLFNIPTNDPWADRGRLDWRERRRSPLIQEGRLRYPATRDEVVQTDGWVFVRDGNLYFAIRPLNGYTLNTDTASSRSNPYRANSHFHMISTPGPRTGFIVDVATAPEFASFAAFRSAVLANPPTINLAIPSVSYQSVRGHTIEASWVPVDYTYTYRPDLGETSPGTIRIRNNMTVDGAVVPADETYPVYQPLCDQGEYLLYFPDGGSVRLNIDRGLYQLRWLIVRTSVCKEPVRFELPGIIETPDNDVWALSVGHNEFRTAPL